MQVEVAVCAPILRLTIFVLSDTLQLPDIDTTNLFFNTPLNDVFRQRVEEMGAALRPFIMESRGPVATRIVAVGDLLQKE